MPTREELVRGNVLNEIADDYEEIDQILKQLTMWANELGITRNEVHTALRSLVDLGWARAYDLHVSKVPLEKPDLNRIEDLYFWITAVGIAELNGFPESWIPPLPD